ncbi:unnamed protein product, partial [Ectocarpus sp. 12 AP-2014]
LFYARSGFAGGAVLHVLRIVAFFLCVLECILRDSTDSLHGRHRYIICRYEIQVLVGVRHIFCNGGWGYKQSTRTSLFFSLYTPGCGFLSRLLYLVFSLIDACIYPGWVVGL